MKILLLIRSLHRGGAERQMLLLARELRMAGHECVICVAVEGGAFFDEAQHLGVPTIVVRKGQRVRLVDFHIRLARAIRAVRPDIIYSFLTASNISALLLKGSVGRAKIICGIRASDVDPRHYGWIAGASERIEAFLSRRADAAIANSQVGARLAIGRGFCAARMYVVPNGIDVARFRVLEQARVAMRRLLGVADETLLVINVSRIDPMKGHADLIRAFAGLPGSLNNARLMCVGEDQTEALPGLMSLATSLGVADRIMFTGPRDDVPELLNAADVACSAARFGEGFPNAVGEAMACGLCAAVTDVGDSALIVGDGRLVAPPRDPLRLAAAIAYAAELPRDPAARAARHKHITATFSPLVMAQSTERVFVAAIRQ